MKEPFWLFTIRAHIDLFNTEGNLLLFEHEPNLPARSDTAHPLAPLAGIAKFIRCRWDAVIRGPPSGLPTGIHSASSRMTSNMRVRIPSGSMGTKPRYRGTIRLAHPFRMLRKDGVYCRGGRALLTITLTTAAPPNTSHNCTFAGAHLLPSRAVLAVP